MVYRGTTRKKSRLADEIRWDQPKSNGVNSRSKMRISLERNVDYKKRSVYVDYMGGSARGICIYSVCDEPLESLLHDNKAINSRGSRNRVCRAVSMRLLPVT